MKNLIISILLLGGCAFGAYTHFADTGRKVATEEARRDTAKEDAAKAAKTLAELEVTLEAKTKEFEAAAISVPKAELATAREEQSKLIAAAKAELDAATAELEAASKAAASPELEKLQEDIAGLTAASAKLDIENARLTKFTADEKALEEKSKASAARRTEEQSARRRR